MEEKGKDTRILYLIIGILLAAIVFLAGGKLKELNIFGVVFDFPTETPVSTPALPISTPTNVFVEPPTTANANPETTLASQLIAEHYILGYTANDLAAKPVLEVCKEPSCRVIFIESLDELPDGWYHLTGNVASATSNLPDGCRTKQELIDLRVIYMQANNYTPCP